MLPVLSAMHLIRRVDADHQPQGPARLNTHTLADLTKYIGEFKNDDYNGQGTLTFNWQKLSVFLASHLGLMKKAFSLHAHVFWEKRAGS